MSSSVSKIRHGRPRCSPGVVALPYRNESLMDIMDAVQAHNPETWEFKDPNTGEEWTGEVLDAHVYESHKLPSYFSQVAYGVTGNQLAELMRRRYGKIKKVAFWLIRVKE